MLTTSPSLHPASHPPWLAIKTWNPIALLIVAPFLIPTGSHWFTVIVNDFKPPVIWRATWNPCQEFEVLFTMLPLLCSIQGTIRSTNISLPSWWTLIRLLQQNFLLALSREKLPSRRVSNLGAFINLTEHNKQRFKIIKFVSMPRLKEEQTNGLIYFP